MRMLRLIRFKVFWIQLCFESYKNGDKIGEEKQKKHYINFTWFGNVLTSIGTTIQNFTITKIELHRRVFIITLIMIKL